jgi:hypothetical protein
VGGPFFLLKFIDLQPRYKIGLQISKRRGKQKQPQGKPKTKQQEGNMPTLNASKTNVTLAFLAPCFVIFSEDNEVLYTHRINADARKAVKAEIEARGYTITNAGSYTWL